MTAEDLIARLQALVAAHGNLPVIFKPEKVHARAIGDAAYHEYFRYWGGLSPNAHVTLIKGKVFLLTTEPDK